VEILQLCSHSFLSRTAKLRNLLTQHWKQTLPAPPLSVDSPSHKQLLIRRPSSAVYCFMLSPPCSQPTRTLHDPQTVHNKSVVYCGKLYTSFRLIQPSSLCYRQEKVAAVLKSVWVPSSSRHFHSPAAGSNGQPGKPGPHRFAYSS